MTSLSQHAHQDQGVKILLCTQGNLSFRKYFRLQFAVCFKTITGHHLGTHTLDVVSALLDKSHRATPDMTTPLLVGWCGKPINMQNAIENMDTNDDSQKAYRSKKNEKNKKNSFCTSANDWESIRNGYIRLSLDFYGLHHQNSNMNLLPSTKKIPPNTLCKVASFTRGGCASVEIELNERMP